MKRNIKYPILKKLSEPITSEEEKKKSKYGNKKVVIEGIKFDSQKEGNRYKELKLMEKSGIISDLRLQVKFELQPSYKLNGKTIRGISYIADFVYVTKENEEVVEDVKPSKNFQTEVYKIKKKIFMYKYKKEITEIY